MGMHQPPEAGGQPQMGMDINTTAQQLAQQIAEMPPEQQQMELQNIQPQSA